MGQVTETIHAKTGDKAKPRGERVSGMTLGSADLPFPLLLVAQGHPESPLSKRLRFPNEEEFMLTS